MKRIKKRDIDSEKLITKSAYAKEHKITPTTVQRMIERGELVIVKAKGAELIHL